PPTALLAQALASAAYRLLIGAPLPHRLARRPSALPRGLDLQPDRAALRGQLPHGLAAPPRARRQDVHLASLGHGQGETPLPRLDLDPFELPQSEGRDLQGLRWPRDQGRARLGPVPPLLRVGDSDQVPAGPAPRARR